MSYSVTIEAPTLSELGGKLLALAAQFHTTGDPVMPEVKAAKPGKSPEKAAPAAKAEDTSSEETTGEASAPAQTEEPASTAGDTDESIPTVGDDVLRDLVVGLVKAKGREVMPPILEQFGVAKATEVTDPARRLELANALRDALGE